MTLAEIKARLKVIAQRMTELAEGDVNEATTAEFASLTEERSQLQGQFQRYEEARQAVEDSARVDASGPTAPYRQTIDRRDDSVNARDFQPATGSGISFRTADGREIRSLRRGEPLTPRGASLPRVGELLRSMITGRHDGMDAAEVRAAVANVDSKGGTLLTPAMSATFIDLARAASIVEKAGAIALPLETSETVLAKLTSDATAGWYGELEAITASEPGFTRITLRPRTLAAIVPISVELIEDSQNAAMLIEQSLQRALAAEMDRCVLCGDGSNGEPQGILSTTGINEETSVGVPTDYTEITDAVTAILEANYDGELSNLAWIQHPTIAGIYAKLVTGTELQPLQPGPWVAPLKRLHTTNLPTTTALVGDFSQVVLGMRTSGVRVQIFDAGSATDSGGTTVNAVTQMAKLIRAHIRMDCCLLQPAWMTVLSGLTTAE